MLIYTVRPAIFCHVYNIHCKIQNGHFPSLSQPLPVITRRTPVKFPESSDKITEIPISDLKSYLHYRKWCRLQQDTRLLDAVTVPVMRDIPVREDLPEVFPVPHANLPNVGLW